MCGRLAALKGDPVAAAAVALGRVVGSRLVRWHHSQTRDHLGTSLFYKPVRPDDLHRIVPAGRRRNGGQRRRRALPRAGAVEGHRLAPDRVAPAAGRRLTVTASWPSSFLAAFFLAGAAPRLSAIPLGLSSFGIVAAPRARRSNSRARECSRKTLTSNHRARSMRAMSDPATAPPFRRSIAVVIGIDGYAHGVPPLRTAVNDARRVGEILSTQHGYEVVSLLDSEATRPRIVALLKEELPGPGRARRPRLPLLRRARRGRRRSRRAERLPAAGGRLPRRREHVPLDAARARSHRRPAVPAHAGNPRLVLLGGLPLERHAGGHRPCRR